MYFSTRNSDHYTDNQPVVQTPLTPIPRRKNLVHLADESIDVLLTVTSVTALDVVLELAGAEATSGVGELEGPEEVVGLLEVGANGVDLVDQILHADNAVLAEVLLDDLVVGERSALLVDLSVTALVDELTDGLEVGVTVGNVGVDDGKHLLGSLGETDESAVVDLEQTEELKDLARLRRNLVDTGILLEMNPFRNLNIVAYPLIRTTKISLGSSAT